jgi:hypothetical protein
MPSNFHQRTWKTILFILFVLTLFLLLLFSYNSVRRNEMYKYCMLLVLSSFHLSHHSLMGILCGKSPGSFPLIAGKVIVSIPLFNVFISLFYLIYPTML